VESRGGQGRVHAADSSIQAALAVQAADRLIRARLLAAQVEIALAAGELGTATQASSELDQIAATYGSSGLMAEAVRARGAVLLAKGQPAEAMPVLREACRSWQLLDAPYHAATVRVLVARACQTLGDEDGTALELNAAAAVVERVGAAADARHVAALRNRARLPDGLTAREVDVLALIAEGRTNKEAAASLVISEKTVARHLANIFTKLGVSSRTAAAAYAIEHGLSPRRPG
jgi:DNA-binding NarL/FixJ family response regulator